MKTDLFSLMIYGLLLERLGVKQIAMHDIPVNELQLMPS